MTLSRYKSKLNHLPHFHFSLTKPENQTSKSLYFLALWVPITWRMRKKRLDIGSKRQSSILSSSSALDWSSSYSTNEIASLNSQLQNLPPFLDMSLNAFLLDFDFTSFFIGLTRNSHAFWIWTHRPLSIVSSKFDD